MKKTDRRHQRSETKKRARLLAGVRGAKNKAFSNFGYGHEGWDNVNRKWGTSYRDYSTAFRDRRRSKRKGYRPWQRDVSGPLSYTNDADY